MSIKTSHLAAAVSAILTLSLAAQAEAQQPAQSGTSAGALEEIIVTARKTEEKLQEAPVAVTALTSQALADRQVSDVGDVAKFAPGLVFDKSFGRATERPVIRGQGNVLANTQAGVEAGAAYFIDGIYYPGDIQSLDMNEVERVEVIRGPQSALYGRNTFSGAINFVTRSPSDQFGGSARAAMGNDEQTYSLRLEGPIAETLAGSLALRYYDFDGQWKNSLTGEDIGQEKTKSVSGVLEWKPNEDLRVRLRGSYNEDRDGTRPLFFQDSSFNNCYPGTRSLAYFATSGSTNANQYYCGTIEPRAIYLNTTAPALSLITAPAVPANAVVGSPAAGAPAGSTRTYDLRPGIAFSGVNRNLRYFSGLADWDIMGSGYRLIVDGGLRGEDRFTGSDSDFTPVNVFPAVGTTYPNGCDPNVCGLEAGNANTSYDEYDDYSVEVKVESPTSRDFHWMLGGFYYKQEQKNYDINFRYPEGRNDWNAFTSTKNKSIFGLVEWTFTEGWTATVEGRYMEETKIQTDRCTTGSATCTRPDVSLPTYPFGDFANGPGTVIFNPAVASTKWAPYSFNEEGSFSKFTPRVTLKWQVNPDLNLFAIYSHGVKPGGFNGSSGITTNQLTYGQETSKNYELGMKSMWLDGRLMFNASAFFIQSKDIQLTTPIYDPVSAVALTSLVTNQGDGEIKGLEVEAKWRVADPLTLSLTYALADTEFTKGCDDFQWTLTSGGGNNAGRQGAYNPANPAAGGTNLNGKGNCSIVGNPFPLSAKHTASLAADFRQPFGDGFEFFTNVDVSYVDERPVQVHANPWVGSATLVGARMGVSSERWSASLYGKNLTNEDSVAVATRWLGNPYIGISTAAIPGTTPLQSATGLAAIGLPAYPPATGSSAGLNSVASYSFPRAFFAALRRERQYGVELSYKF